MSRAGRRPQIPNLIISSGGFRYKAALRNSPIYNGLRILNRSPKRGITEELHSKQPRHVVREIEKLTDELAGFWIVHQPRPLVTESLPVYPANSAHQLASRRVASPAGLGRNNVARRIAGRK
jgi:hypothetical protein